MDEFKTFMKTYGFNIALAGFAILVAANVVRWFVQGMGG